MLDSEYCYQKFSYYETFGYDYVMHLWSMAELTCRQNDGGSLASVHSQLEVLAILANWYTYDPLGAWIGLVGHSE